MSLHLSHRVAGFALLAALAGCGGTAVAAHSSGGKPTAPAVMHSRYAAPAPSATKPATQHPATPPAARPSPTRANPIPQGNGGDHDADNSGGPSDGDGNL